MDIEQTKAEIKVNEGFRMEVYKDTLGFSTGGYGHKMLEGETPPTDMAGWNKLFERDFARAMSGAEDLLMICPNVDDTARHLVVEMCYQMGSSGVSKFKGMLSALQESDYVTASKEMLDSKWAKQTPYRAKRMAERMKSI